MIGMVGLANKPGGFEDADVHTLDPVLVTIGQLIAAWKAKRERPGGPAGHRPTVPRGPADEERRDHHLARWPHRVGERGFHARLFGYPFEEILGRRPRELMHGPDTDPVTEQAIFAAMSQGLSFQHELLAYRRGGEAIWVELESNPLIGRRR